MLWKQRVYEGPQRQTVHFRRGVDCAVLKPARRFAPGVTDADSVIVRCCGTFRHNDTGRSIRLQRHLPPVAIKARAAAVTVAVTRVRTTDL